MEAEQSVSTYVLKTCFMSLLRERYNATSKGTGQSINIISTRSITWAKMIYVKLEENLKRYHKVPHMFYEDWDVYFGEYRPHNHVKAPRDQMFDDRKMSVTLLHCEIITNMLSTLDSDLNFSPSEDSNEIALHYRQPYPRELTIYDPHIFVIIIIMIMIIFLLYVLFLK